MPSATPSKTTRRPIRSLVTVAAAVAAAAVVATIASAGPGSAPNLAQADPGDTFVPIGSSQLLQSEDLTAIQVKLDTAKVVLNRDDDFSSCLGEGNPWTSVLKGSNKPFTVSWTSRRNANQGLTESIAQAPTPAEAKAYAKTLVEEAIGLCQGDKSNFDFHYGATESSPVGKGSATWALSYTGDSKRADGGVIVFSKGTNFGILQVSGTWGPADQTMESLAKVAVSRLA
ncbi:hypothetical protein [Kribbella catacumbae]|uniref:hypothetical protein n=1 Tax=Kribbella catacumbae TaxID=460086 RepID=UPI00035DE662|nr:hypothetical protein [Kribbella catacumbae]